MSSSSRSSAALAAALATLALVAGCNSATPTGRSPSVATVAEAGEASGFTFELAEQTDKLAAQAQALEARAATSPALGAVAKELRDLLKYLSPVKAIPYTPVDPHGRAAKAYHAYTTNVINTPALQVVVFYHADNYEVMIRLIGAADRAAKQVGFDQLIVAGNLYKDQASADFKRYQDPGNHKNGPMSMQVSWQLPASGANALTLSSFDTATTLQQVRYELAWTAGLQGTLTTVSFTDGLPGAPVALSL